MTAILNELSREWIQYAVPAIIQNTIFISIVLWLLRLMKGWSAKYRFIVAMTGLVKLLLPPFLRMPFPVPSFINPASSLRVSTIFFAEGSSPAAGSPALSGQSLLFLLWSGLVLFFILVPLAHTLILRFRLRGADRLNASGLLPRSIRLYLSTRADVPMILGLFPRKIYVPPQWNHWTKEGRRLILQHELAHIERLDGLSRLLQLLAFSLYCFHPLVWLLNYKVDVLREMACDDRSLNFKPADTPLDYSRVLLELAETTPVIRWRFQSPSCFINRKKDLVHRISYQIEEKRITQPGKIIPVIICLVLAFVFFSWNCQSDWSTNRSSDNSDQSSERISEDADPSVPQFQPHEGAPIPIGGMAAIQANVVYPENNIEGTVLVYAGIGKDGKVTGTRILESLHKDFDQAAIEAIKKTSWIPAKHLGEPVPVWIVVPVIFKTR